MSSSCQELDHVVCFRLFCDWLWNYEHSLGWYQEACFLTLKERSLQFFLKTKTISGQSWKGVTRASCKSLDQRWQVPQLPQAQVNFHQKNPETDENYFVNLGLLTRSSGLFQNVCWSWVREAHPSSVSHPTNSPVSLESMIPPCISNYEWLKMTVCTEDGLIASLLKVTGQHQKESD